MAGFYVRIRGRVQGPYQPSQVRVLVQKGQLGRFHEISSDNVTWNKVADYPELLTAPARGRRRVVTAAKHIIVRMVVGGVCALGRIVNRRPLRLNSAAGIDSDPGPAGGYFYGLQGVKHGPVSRQQLRQLYLTMQLAPATPVWREGLAEWLTLATLPEFVGLGANPSAIPQQQHQPGYIANSPATENANSQLISSLLASRIWVLFIVIFGYVSLVLHTVVVVINLAGISRLGSPIFVPFLLYVLLAMPVLICAIACHLFWWDLSSLNAHKTEGNLIKATRSSARCWRIFGSIAVVGLLLIVLGFLFFLAALLDLATMPSRFF